MIVAASTTVIVCGVVAALVILFGDRLFGPSVRDAANVLGENERCITCHPGGRLLLDDPQRAHPRQKGHEQLNKLGCTPCHGGDPTQTRAEQAHGPMLGKGPRPFLPRELTKVACYRCHIVGELGETHPVAAGQKEYVGASCPSCHQPGGHPFTVGLDLRLLAQRPREYLTNLFVDPRAQNPASTMWSLRDATYDGRFADTPEGRKRIKDLVAYVIALGDHPERQRHAAAWVRPDLKIDGDCVACHKIDGSPTKGEPHRCLMLRHNNDLQCRRCHRATEPPSPAPSRKASFCPQIRASLFLCSTCHLRQLAASGVALAQSASTSKTK